MQIAENKHDFTVKYVSFEILSSIHPTKLLHKHNILSKENWQYQTWSKINVILK